MYAVMIGEDMVRVADKEDAKKLVNVLFDLNCSERISSKPLSGNEKIIVKKED